MKSHVLMVLASREASETFIAREIEALQQSGLPLVVVTLAELTGFDFPSRNIVQQKRTWWRNGVLLG